MIKLYSKNNCGLGHVPFLSVTKVTKSQILFRCTHYFINKALHSNKIPSLLCKKVAKIPPDGAFVPP